MTKFVGQPGAGPVPASGGGWSARRAPCRRCVRPAGLLGALAGIVLVGGLVAACQNGARSGDPTATRSGVAASAEPQGTGPTATPTHPDPEPRADEFDAAVPPERPAGLSGEPSEDSAAQVARYFHELAAYAFATGDLATWKAMSSDGCRFCAAVVGKVEAEAAAGEHREGGRVQVLDVQAYHHKGDQYAALVTLREHESRVIAADGSVASEVDYKQDVQLEMLLTWNRSGWVVDGVDIKYANRL